MSHHRTALLAALGAIGLLLTACSSGDEASAIQPIEPILASEIDIAVDPSGTSATLAVDTSIPVACAVIFGTDDTYGSIAVDNDMQGGAHQIHGPLLTGLTPDTEYQYVLQGSDAAGTIYRSEVLSFRTPAAVDTGLGTNIAPNGTISAVSSEFSADFAAANAIDGDISTEWSSAGDGDDAFIEIDLGGVQEVSAVAYRTRQMTDGSAITETFTITIDGETFDPQATGAEPFVLASPVAGRVVRIEADLTTGGNTGATEIEIYTTE